MVGRGKSKKGRSKGLSQRRKEDRISQLPDPLICHILSCLPTKEAVETSVLSTRWRSLWLWVPSLELDSREFQEFNTFMSFVDRLFDSNRMSCIQKLKLILDENANEVDDASYLTYWIDAATKRKVQHLDVWCDPDCLSFEIPRSLYVCETLVSLKLHEVVLHDAGVVSLPCLKTMHLKYVWYPKDAIFERLVSCCPVLEELKILGCSPKVFLVNSSSLKRLKIKLRGASYMFEVVIDATLLRFLKIVDFDSESYIIKNLGCNAKLDISLSFGVKFDDASVSSKRNIIRDFLPGISKVGEMIIYLDTFKVFHHYSKLEPLPRFAYMSSLDATICLSDLKWLPTFLLLCPNLKSLVLALDNDYDRIDSEEMNQISFSSVPECLLSSLKSVDIRSNISGNAAEMKLVRYFLENSIALETLTLGFHSSANETVIFKKLLKIPRRSITCQVVVR